jgi:hydrogenase nickel incorporation protein HypA/HybF
VHETGIVRELLDSVNTAAVEAGATSVDLVRVSVGELTEVVPEAMQFAWTALIPGTLSEGAVLEVTVMPARSVCSDCGAEFGHDRFDRSCPECGSYLCGVVAGNELRLGSVDVTVPDPVET